MLMDITQTGYKFILELSIQQMLLLIHFDQSLCRSWTGCKLGFSIQWGLLSQWVYVTALSIHFIPSSCGPWTGCKFIWVQYSVRTCVHGFWLISVCKQRTDCKFMLWSSVFCEDYCPFILINYHCSMELDSLICLHLLWIWHKLVYRCYMFYGIEVWLSSRALG